MSRASGNGEMDDGDMRDAVIERALASVGRPRADPAFRTRLREQFLDVAAASEPRMRPVRERSNVFPLMWPAVLAASVALVIFFVLSRDAVVRWHVIDQTGAGHYVVDDYAVDGSDAKRLADLLQTAKTIETGEQGLRVQLLDQVVIELAPHSRVSQMRFPPAGAYAMHVDSGSVRVGTGPGYPGGLIVSTDDMKAAVAGTFLAIDMVPAGTCLCCLHGKVMCDARDKTGAHAVEDGRRGFAYRAGKPPVWDAAEQAHLEPLRALESAVVWK
jgi:hypothetical protein